MSLPIFVTQDKWQDFDDAWSELMATTEPLDELFVALRRAGEKNRIARCMPLVNQHLELLEMSDRHADAANLLGTAIEAGAPTASLADSLMKSAAAAWSMEPWWDRALEMTGLNDPTRLRKAWSAFTKLQDFKVGVLIFHSTGWGTGEIFDVTEDGTVVHVRFQSGREDYFPLGAALDIFDVLDPTDLRSRSYRDPEGLKKEVKKDPLDALKAILKRYHGRANSIAIKNALAQIGIEGSAHSAWWRKAKPLAENSEWFRMTGSGKKIEMHLLLTAVDPKEQLERQLKHAASLEDIVIKARGLLGKENLDSELDEMTRAALTNEAANEDNEYGWRLSCWVLMREFGGVTPEPLLEILEAAAVAEAPEDDSNHVPALWNIFQELPTPHDQEQAIGILVEILEEAWVDEAVKNLEHAPPGMVRNLVERLVTAKREEDLGKSYRYLLKRTSRAPHMLLALAKLAEAEKLGGDLPPRLARAQAYANLATQLFADRRKTPALGRAHTRLVDFLAGGASPLLGRLLEDAVVSEVRSIQRLMQRGVEESIENQLIMIATHAVDDDENARAAYFWENDSIWTTRSGKELLARELKELKDVKMPENEDAIGRAAALGDLSENSEWESALEEKRNLSSRCSVMEEELSQTELLENAILPENMVCPGTAVEYMEKGNKTSNVIILLGPWDGDRGENVVSYRAPLAQGLLGLSPGAKREIQLPGGLIDVEVLSVVPVDVD
ncbi:MAG: transcription elongation factor GreA [Planctomycetota bacterium]|jgi:transcription elongation factor GreA